MAEEDARSLAAAVGAGVGMPPEVSCQAGDGLVGMGPALASGVQGLITQLLCLPAAAAKGNLDVAHAATLQQARALHLALTGHEGPTAEPPASSPDVHAPGAVAAGPAAAGAPAAAAGSPTELPVPCDPPQELSPQEPPAPTAEAGPTPAESLEHEARVRAAALSRSPARRSADRSRSPLGPAAAASAAAAIPATARDDDPDDEDAAGETPSQADVHAGLGADADAGTAADAHAGDDPATGGGTAAGAQGIPRYFPRAADGQAPPS